MEELEKTGGQTRANEESENQFLTFLFNAKCEIQHAMASDGIRDRKDYMALYRIRERINSILDKY